MDIWGVLGIFPTKDRREIRRAYAAQSKLHHAESDPEGFQRLYRAYQAALEYAQKNQEQQLQPPPAQKEQISRRRVIPSSIIKGKLQKSVDARQPQREKVLDASLTGEDGLDFGGIFQEWERENREAYHSNAALRTFISLFSEEKSRSSQEVWKKYIVSKEFLDVQYDPGFVQYLTEFLNTQQFVEREKLPQALCIGLFIAYSLYYIQKRVVDEETIRPLVELMRRQETLAGTLRKLSSDRARALTSLQEAFYRYNQLLRCCYGNQEQYRLSDWVEILQFTRSAALSVTGEQRSVPRPPEFFLLLAHLVKSFPLSEEIRAYLYELYQLDHFERSSNKRELQPLFEALKSLDTPQAREERRKKREEKEWLKRVFMDYYCLYESTQGKTDPALALPLLSSEDFQKAMYHPWFLHKLEEFYESHDVSQALALATFQVYRQGTAQARKLLELLSSYQKAQTDTMLYIEN